VHRRVSDRARLMLDRIAGILLTAIAVTLLASGFTRLVVQTYDAFRAS
jgi:multiple antibiotic resistance protein